MRRVGTGHLLASYPEANALPLAVAPNGKVTLRWQGGSGLYRVQARSQLSKGDWHYLGPPTTNTTFTHSAKSHLYYRVQSLP